MDKIDISPKVKDESMYKIISLFAGLLLIFVGIKDRELVKIVFGLLFAFYYTYRKKIYITDQGVVFEYKGFMFNKEEFIHRKDIHEVLVVKQRVKSALYFVIEPTAKRIFVDTEKLDDIMQFIKKRLKLSITVESRIK